MPKPELSEIPEYYRTYVDAVTQENLVHALVIGGGETADFLRAIPEQSGDYKYAVDKWTIKQLVAHLIDAERVFSYRALTIARNDKTPLPGFEQTDWALEANVANRQLFRMIEEYNNVRASTIDLFGSFTKDMLQRVGTASGQSISVNALGFIIAGHEIHHTKIIEERYLS